MKRFWANYIFILIPFLVLIITKLVMSKFEEVLTSTDWSMASFMIIAQSLGTLIIGTHKKGININGLLIFIGITIMLLIVCLGVYAYVLTRSDVISGYIQIVLFIISSIWMAAIYKAEEYIKVL
ncbi:hypothetical protein UB34_06140 [Photobacterium leiognathi]|uniref:Uncharacterized protein n=1 Tax=Photobacterium leiognathi TaxID=553611 RepID=A0A2T3M6A9_PHOLE|nr:hypothetical protein UB34_06140 [Photobacterium leiognathi]PSV87469.1 hypothetical protein CTM89_17315 [Photobacterium leiognathi]